MILAKRRGFSLLELLIALGLLALAMTWVLASQVEKQNIVAREGVAAQFFDEFRIVARAATEYAKDHAKDWTAGSPVSITIAQLTTESLLPSGFATRRTGSSRTPLGSIYTIRAVRNAKGAPSVVVYETSTDHTYYVQQLGLDNSAAPELTKIRRDAAARLAAAGIAVAMMGPGTTIASGIGGNLWTKNLTGIISTVPTRSALTVLTGFPDLTGLNNGPGTEPPERFSGDCKILTADMQCRNAFGTYTMCSDPSAVWQEQSCSSAFGPGWENMDTVTACPSSGEVSFRSTVVGTISYATSSSTLPDSGQCYSHCQNYPFLFACKPSADTNWQTEFHRQELRLNDQLVAQQICETRRDSNMYLWQRNQVCGYHTGSKPWASSSVQSSNPHHVLCCRSQ